jgi:sortase A
MFIFLGIFVVGQVVYPIAAWYLFTLPTYSGGIASPLATNFRPESSPLFPTIVQAAEALNPNGVNSYNPKNWFVGAKDFTGTLAVKTYSITIPKLGIDAATVKVGDVDLKKSLIAWETSALPGNYGNNIIFGHSELPQFASPKRYDGIFTHITDLQDGDQIILDYDGVRYRYGVISKKIVSPTDLSVLEQRFDDAYVSLITCAPPGTLWMRAVVVARMIKS